MSATVGRSGSSAERVAVVTASARTLPPLMCGIDAAVVSNMSCTWPPIRSVIAPAAPRYGTCTMSTPAVSLNSSPAMWMPVPTPAEAKFSLPGLALACAISSGMVLTGSVGIDHHDVGRACGAGDRRDVAQEVEAQLLIERVVDRVRRHPLQQRVAVRRRLHHRLGPDVAAGARPVLDQDRLAEPLGEPLRHQAGEDVGAAAGSEADDDADRLRRISLRGSGARDRRQRGGAGGELQKSTAWNSHCHSSHCKFSIFLTRSFAQPLRNRLIRSSCRSARQRASPVGRVNGRPAATAPCPCWRARASACPPRSAG